MSSSLSWARWFAAAALLMALWTMGSLRAQNANPSPDQTISPGTADRAWDDLLRNLPDSKTPADWQSRPPAPEQVAAFETLNGVKAGKAADRARAFQKAFPSDPRVQQARQLEYQLLNLAVQLGNSARNAELTALETARLKDPDLSEDERFELRMRQAMRPFIRLPDQNKEAALGDLEKSVRGLQAEFPKRQEVYEILSLLAQALLENNHADRSRALALEIVAGATGETRTNAQGLLRRLDRLGQPLQLKCTTIDGKPLDLEQFRGKVVLLDFWATWCAPCRTQLPELKAAYEKFHAQGFQIVGISLDDNKPAVEKFVRQEAVAWPQVCDGRGWQSAVARQFDINAIPALWLIDRSGKLRDLSAREGLAQRVESLLAEK
jgi:peroxiredoxin